MKQKLTITGDSGLLPTAKRYACSQGMSLSALIERSLREVAMETALSFSERWRGRFREADTEGDPRYDVLARKYLT